MNILIVPIWLILWLCRGWEVYGTTLWQDWGSQIMVQREKKEGSDHRSMVDATTTSFKARGWKLTERVVQSPIWVPSKARQIWPNLVLSSIIRPYLNHSFSASPAVWYITSLIYVIEHWTLIIQKYLSFSLSILKWSSTQGGPDDDLQ